MAEGKKENSKSNSSSNMRPSRLYRSEKNRIIGGVCGGLGKYFNIDPTLIRIIFVLITLFGGSGILIYLILWLVIPSESSQNNISQDHIKANVNEMRQKAEKFVHDIKFTRSRNTDSRNWWAILLIILGTILLLNNYGYYDFSEARRLWPLLLIILGLVIIFRK